MRDTCQQHPRIERAARSLENAPNCNETDYTIITPEAVFEKAPLAVPADIHQNYRHVCAVRELLQFLDPAIVHPVVVFTGDAVFKTDVPDGVFTLPKFLAYIESHRTEVMSVNRAQFCVGRLEATRLAITQATDVEHVLELRRQHGIYD